MRAKLPNSPYGFDEQEEVASSILGLIFLVLLIVVGVSWLWSA